MTSTSKVVAPLKASRLSTSEVEESLKACLPSTSEVEKLIYKRLKLSTLQEMNVKSGLLVEEVLDGADGAEHRAGFVGHEYGLLAAAGGHL